MPDEPPPVPAGKTVNFRVNVPTGQVWFAVKVFDEASNISTISNVESVDVE